MKKILSPLADPVFKRIFGTEKEILIEFINTFIKLENPVVAIEFLPVEIVSESEVEKTPIVDVRCMDSSNRQFIVEIQLSPQKDFKKRALFYLSKVFSRQLLQGDGYELLEPVYILSLLNFQLFNDFQNGYHSYSMAHEEHGSNHIEGLHLIFIELPKLKKITNFNQLSLQDYWMLFLTQPEQLHNMKQSSQLHEYTNLLKAVDLLDESKYTPAQLAAYDRYQDNIRTYNSVMRTKFEEGVEKGEKIGIAKGEKIGEKIGIEKGEKIGVAKGEKLGMEKTRNKFIAIIQEIKKGNKSVEQIAAEFDESVEFILSIK